ncbi:trifunctional transcriptional regulator/proline dehydrogenase/L-glutamate gamma-semialdehyde dehydrogenase [Pseudorhodoferax soli]|uniref:Bifunctional protein PutA n=1 Tax=Pseudorhodoferax soli TaxID=545864 RepID=A0A368Y336_9BURK|nr:trifunctional transcriptional regulator/proline dehydrogenase/L-glutamate gamma-semialdehyde dehydrogenase [Pseudorhodoferax soli]RCW74515.1 L-proline dehydrogenase /delta-1-pyrroline-5-carboxylate dehydrogenase [Pseudorhodoferax soli]
MSLTTLGIKVDELFRSRLKAAAEAVGRSPHWFIKQAVLSAIEKVEGGVVPGRLVGAGELGTAMDGLAHLEGATEVFNPATMVQPFLAFAQGVAPQSVRRAAITAAYRRPEAECVPLLLGQARQSAAATAKAEALARKLVTALRARGSGGGVEGLLQEFSLSSQEGVALMCMAEALLRIPDRATRDALIRDKISQGDWHSHVGHSPSLFVNAATWGLLLTGKLVATSSEKSLSSALSRLIGKGGEPLIRKGVDTAMRVMGEQFVTGESISSALANARKHEAKGFRYSYDMLGEAATTAEDAARYLGLYEQAIHAIGRASAGRGIYEGPGISIKLSALHPRYARAQHERVVAELLPRVRALALLARRYDIGMNIDAEEADRLELSLDLLEALCFDPALQGWDGIGFVVQAYQKRCPFVIDHLVELAQRSSRRLMVRLVKGAYWDSEIKRAQVDGLEDYPVFTRKLHTDISYLACARKLLAQPQAIYPQFATHNAYTLAAIYQMAGANYYPGQYEFQCLHGMGEPLYEEVVGTVADGKLARPCRIYAPVGTHETLLAYLVRRLLENGANTSFVNQIADPRVPVDALVADPIDAAERAQPLGAPHERIPLPRDLYRDADGGGRDNSAGLDLSNEQRLASLATALLGSTARPGPGWQAGPTGSDWDAGRAQPVRNPADRRDVVGQVVEASEAQVDAALAAAADAAPIWQSTPPPERARCLERAADALEAQMQALLGLIVREAGKTLPNAIAEVREAVDFLRYYAAQARTELAAGTELPLGPVLCISPWNFPLAIFTGQLAAALAAGNVVLAKPAEQTPLIAACAVDILHAAGVPHGALQLLPGAGETVGARLVSDARVRGVMFTGSTDVARLIARQLAERLDDQGRTIPLIAETGGQNAMVVDSSALPEQVVLDVLQSAYDSAGQRCSALRLLCLQEDVADRMLAMLRGALHELAVGNPDRLETDVGPVIDEAAREAIEKHVAAMAAAGCKVERLPLPPACAAGSFVAPALIEIDSPAQLEREVFGPVLHVLRWRREGLPALIDAINATGYGLTFGLHTRIDETIAQVTARIHAGNVYVNRNVVGAVVGVQPFGGEGLSGTGPKAGGPLYLHRLLSAGPRPALRLGEPTVLPGPTGERNLYSLAPRGTVLCVAATAAGARAQWEAVRATGNRALWTDTPAAQAHVAQLSEADRGLARVAGEAQALAGEVHAALFEGDPDALRALNRELAARNGPIVSVQGLASDEIASGRGRYALERLVVERAVSTNTAAAGGNASLMAIG